MRTNGFDVVFEDLSEVTGEQAESLFEAGCDDGTPSCRDGTAWVHFDRTASSL
jgi:hypothetical protein